MATSLPGITSTSANNTTGYAGSSSAGLREGGSATGNERFKLTAGGGKMSARERTSQISQDEKRKGCCAGG